MQCLNSKNKRVVGVDITRAGVNLVEMSFAKGSYSVQQVFREYDVRQETSIRRTPKDDVLCLRRALLHAGIQAKQAVVAVPDIAVMSHQRVVPRALTDYEMEELIGRESELARFYPNTELSMDFQIRGSVEDAAHLLQVLVVEAKLEVVNQRVQLLQQAGLQVMAVDIESHAMLRALRYAKAKGKFLLTTAEKLSESRLRQRDGRIFLVNVGLLSLHLFVFQGGDVLFAREERWSQPESLERISSDLQGLIQIFLVTSGQSGMDELILSGEYRHLINLQSLLACQMRVPVRIVDPLGVIPVNLTRKQDYLLHSSSALLQACGLALWGRDDRA